MNVRLAVAALLVTCSVGRAESVHVISTGTGPFAPSFRGEANSTYFAWDQGQWNTNPSAGSPTERVFRTAPSTNPGGVTATLVRSAESIASYPNIVSSSGNIYTGPATIDMTLTAPTAGVVGTGFTTIIVQGNSLGGFGGLPIGELSVFSFGDINGVAPEYIRYANTQGETQWWAKWELVGNEASYQFDVNSIGLAAEPYGILSVSDLVVDTYWSATGFAADRAFVTPEAAAVPEPSSIAMCTMAALGLGAFRASKRKRLA